MPAPRDGKGVGTRSCPQLPTSANRLGGQRGSGRGGCPSPPAGDVQLGWPGGRGSCSSRVPGHLTGTEQGPLVLKPGHVSSQGHSGLEIAPPPRSQGHGGPGGGRADFLKQIVFGFYHGKVRSNLRRAQQLSCSESKVLLTPVQGWTRVLPSVLQLQGPLVGRAPTASPGKVADAHGQQQTHQQVAQENKLLWPKPKPGPIQMFWWGAGLGGSHRHPQEPCTALALLCLRRQGLTHASPAPSLALRNAPDLVSAPKREPGWEAEPSRGCHPAQPGAVTQHSPGSAQPGSGCSALGGGG